MIKPFDMAEVIAGQGTTGLEIADQAGEAGVTEGEVLVPCGGGGLTAGIALAREFIGTRSRVAVIESGGLRYSDGCTQT